jgi:fused signal recognition particle receptor
MLYCKDFRIYDDRDEEEHSVIIGCDKKKEIKIINKNITIPEKLVFETPIVEDREPVIINLKLPTPEPNEPSVPQKEEPLVEEPVVEEPVVEEPLVEEPVVEEPLVEEPVVEEPVVEEPLVEEPVVEEPLVEEPVVEEPVVEEPVVEEPVVEEPVVEEPQKNTTKSLFSLDDVDLNFVGELVSGGFL